jgi:hypothetical protein
MSKNNTNTNTKPNTKFNKPAETQHNRSNARPNTRPNTRTNTRPKAQSNARFNESADTIYNTDAPVIETRHKIKIYTVVREDVLGMHPALEDFYYRRHFSKNFGETNRDRIYLDLTNMVTGCNLHSNYPGLGEDEYESRLIGQIGLLYKELERTWNGLVEANLQKIGCGWELCPYDLMGPCNKGDKCTGFHARAGGLVSLKDGSIQTLAALLCAGLRTYPTAENINFLKTWLAIAQVPWTETRIPLVTAFNGCYERRDDVMEGNELRNLPTYACDWHWEGKVKILTRVRDPMGRTLPLTAEMVRIFSSGDPITEKLNEAIAAQGAAQVSAPKPEIPAPKPEIPAPKPEIPAPKPEIPAPKPEPEPEKPDQVSWADELDEEIIDPTIKEYECSTGGRGRNADGRGRNADGCGRNTGGRGRNTGGRGRNTGGRGRNAGGRGRNAGGRGGGRGRNTGEHRQKK